VNLNPQLLRVIEDNLVQLAAVAVEHGARLAARRRLLVDDDLARVPLVDVEAVGLQVDGDGAHFVRDGSVGPSVEDAPRVGPEGDDVSEYFERGE
jgi:hypothetical protein